jgi:4'-phosphopantetheinyl transferase
MNPPPAAWREISAIPPVAPAEIQVWRINLASPAAEIARLEILLSAGEKNQAAQFHFDRDRRRFIVRRTVLRQLLVANLGLPPEQIQIESAGLQKPKIAAAQNPRDLRFNTSHSGDVALVALATNCEIGVDIEQHRALPDAGGLALNFFSDLENRLLARLPEHQRLEGFFNCWTRKEAFVKAVGQGLSYPLKNFSVELSPGKPAAILENSDAAEPAEKWSVRSLDAGVGFSAALVFAGKNHTKIFFEWRH